MSQIFLTKHDPAQNAARFYELRLEADLFGSTVLVREWGRIGGASRTWRGLFASAEAAAKACDVQRRRMIRRGYMPAGSSS